MSHHACGIQWKILVVKYWGGSSAKAEIASAEILGHDCSQVTINIHMHMHLSKLKL